MENNFAGLLFDLQLFSMCLCRSKVDFLAARADQEELEVNAGTWT